MSQKGRIFKSTGSWYTVELGDQLIQARIRGKLRIQGFKATNPVTVGDIVDVEQDAGGDYQITGIDDRKNFLLRKSINLSKQLHFIAANIDQLVLMVSLRDPVTQLGFIDRVLSAAESQDIVSRILINKIDLCTEEELEDITNLYRNVGYEVWHSSLTSDQHVEELKSKLANQVSLLTGVSGVGKSTLVNMLENKEVAKIGDISDAHLMGQHTTTFAEMHPLTIGGYIIDTPGIKSFGITEIDMPSLSHFFPEMKEILPNCKFSNCQHLNEPGCAVLKAVREGKVAPSRYRNYVDIRTGE